MYKITEKRALHKFKCVRVLSGRDLFSRLGERIPNDRGDVMPRHPSTRQDLANDYVMDGYSRLQEKEIEPVPPTIPPAVPPGGDESNSDA